MAAGLRRSRAGREPAGPSTAGPRRVRASHRVTVLAAGLIAVAIALAADLTAVMDAQEQETVGLRFQLRGPQPAGDVALLAIDDESLADLGAWPFRRSLHAKAVDALRAAGAKDIVYDVQFSEPTRARDDLALYDALGRAGGAVLAATATDAGGDTAVFGGRENLGRSTRSRPPRPSSRVERDLYLRFPHAAGGLRTMAVAAARRPGAGSAPATSRRAAPGSTTAGRRGPCPRFPSPRCSTPPAARRHAARPHRGRGRHGADGAGRARHPDLVGPADVRPGDPGERDLDRAARPPAAQRPGLAGLARRPRARPRPRRGGVARPRARAGVAALALGAGYLAVAQIAFDGRARAAGRLLRSSRCCWAR